jgi:hypothetical protein
MQAYRSQSRDGVERIGIMIWKIAVLVIGLHCTLLMIPQQGLLDGFVIGSSLLQASALVLLTVGMAWVVVNYVRARWSWTRHARYAPQPGLNAQSHSWIALHGSEWLLALGLEGMLAAQIIQVSIAYIGQNELSWARIGALMIIALSRILI